MKNKNSIPKVFREEAIKHYSRDLERGDLLKPSPLWTWMVLTITGALITLAATFASIAEVGVVDRAEGSVQLVDVQVLPAAVRQSFGVVVMLNNNSRSLPVGGGVSLELRDYPRREFGSLDGRVLRFSPAQVLVDADPDNVSTLAAISRMEILIIRPTSGPLAAVQLHAGMPVSVQMTVHKQRLIAFVLDPLRQRPK